jgi:hypothetical protein
LAAERGPKDKKDATGTFLGQFPGAGDGILTKLPLRSHLHGGSLPQKHGDIKYRGLSLIIL